MTAEDPPAPPTRSPFRLLGRFLVWAAIYFVLDFTIAVVCRHLIPWWDATAAERAYRRPSAEYHHGLAANVTATALWGGAPYPYRTDALGLRAADTGAVPLVAARRRTLLLGDSFTEAVGVSYGASYAGLLDSLARTNGGEVLNAAVLSYSPSLYFRKARYLLDRVGLKIDAIVVALDVSDPYDEVERYRVRSDGQVESVEAEEPLARRISLWLRIHTVWGRAIGALALAQERLARPLPIAVGSMPSTWTCRGARPTPLGVEGLARAAEGMDSVVQLAHRHALPIAVVVYPWEDQILKGEVRSCQAEFWSSWASRREVPLVNLYPLFIGGRPADSVVRRYFIPYDVHWSPAGHRLVADSLWNSVVGRLISGDQP
jgi:hypothetical protein